LLLLAALAAAALIQRRRGAREVWFFLIVIFILTLVANEVRPMISEGRTRYLIHLWPLLALLVGLGLAALEAGRFRRWTLPLLAVWLAFGVGNTLNSQFLIDMDGPRYLKDYPPLREIVAAVNPLAEPEDLLITFSRQGHVYNIFRFFTVGAYHTQNLIPQGYFATLPETRAPVEVRGDLLNSLGTRLTVWFETEPITPPDQLALYRDILDERYVRCDSPVQRPDFVLDRYHLAALGCVENDLVASPLLHADAGIDLHGLRAVVQDDQMLVAANWTVADSVPANTYSVSLKLWPADAPHPADGFLAQMDYGLRGAGSGWQFQAQPLDHVPPRDYVLTATLYNWSTGERLPLVNAAGEAGDELEIGSVTIEAES
ncbi:MAG: hypothetical protein K8J31_24175, partial [Anaerolineae bacterium]|nr:hypothetical protein [Anaerolineae bacterium]